MKKIFTFILTAFLILPVISQSTVKQQLEKILSAGCVKDGVIVSMQSTNPSLQLAIKQESSRTPGKFRYVFVDKRIGAFNENGKFEFSASKMSCPQLSENSSQSSSGTPNNSSSKTHKCNWCGRDIQGNGFSISGGEIRIGKYYDPFMAKMMGATDNVGDYCSRKCAFDSQ
jgi:hypothetical protein